MPSSTGKLPPQDLKVVPYFPGRSLILGYPNHVERHERTYQPLTAEHESKALKDTTPSERRNRYLLFLAWLGLVQTKLPRSYRRPG